jgi:aminoglycoside 6-adenylyltransferase
VNHESLLVERILPWATARDDVRGLAELGSRTSTAPADEWADMDLMLLVRDPMLFHDSDDWIHEIGPAWLSLKHPGPFGDLPVRQVLFEGALDFDIVALAAGTLAKRLDEPTVAFALGGGFQGGFRALIDKDNEIANLDLPHHPPLPDSSHISAEDFDFVVSDFLFQVVWASKHLRRGELWAAKDDVDGYMKADLAQVIEWHTIAIRPGTNTRSGGRYLERWADPLIVERLADTFAAYEALAVARALIAMIQLFEDVASETAAALGFSYPDQSHAAVFRWATETLSPLVPDIDPSTKSRPSGQKLSTGTHQA